MEIINKNKPVTDEDIERGKKTNNYHRSERLKNHLNMVCVIGVYFFCGILFFTVLVYIYGIIKNGNSEEIKAIMRSMVLIAGGYFAHLFQNSLE